MILVPIFPLHKPISFLPQTKLVQLGKVGEEEAIICSHYHEVQAPLWVKLTEERLRIIRAKQTYTECTAKERWSKWDEATLASYKLQFRMFDLNEDGLIDFNELCHALDEIGDISSLEERQQYFRNVDTDMSGGIDLEEFLEVIDNVQGESCGESKRLSLTSGAGVVDMVRIGQLSVAEQIKHGLF